MKKIFMIGLGGSIENANVEVHSMQFVIAEKIEDCYDELKDRWYGVELHIDSYTVLEYIDGYKVELNRKSGLDLFMIVYGGYKKGVIDELHDYYFLLANSKEEASALAKEQYDKFQYMNHVDEVVNVFDNAEARFGFVKGDFKFSDNITIHTFTKLM